MKYLVNSREMKCYDSNTTEHYRIPSIVLMERAAVAFTEELYRQNVDLTRVLTVCGSGNNGGDGFAIARILMLAGVQTDIVFAGDESRTSESNRLQREILQAYQFEIYSEIPEGRCYTAVIDALLGVGLSREITGNYAAIIEKMNTLTGCKIAVDIASGISSDTGAILGTAFRADMTVTFAYEKLGMRLWPGADCSGQIYVEDIGIGEPSRMGEIPSVAALEDSDIRCWNERESRSNKGTFGKLLVIAGSINMAGAAVLCANAAYAAGSGLVRVYTPEENRVIMQTKVPEAVLTTYPAQNPDMDVLAEALQWADAVVCGPGIGTSEAASATVSFVLQNVAVPVLLDADALNIMAKDLRTFEYLHTEAVITPHLGEMSRLTGKSVAEIQNCLTEVAEEFAKQYNVICVLKDARTVTGIPSGQTYLNLSGNAGMATAGSGDVLSGIIGSLLAQGMCAKEAAPLGVYVHGRAGDFAAAELGMRSMTASDIIDGLRSFSRERNGISHGELQQGVCRN